MASIQKPVTFAVYLTQKNLFRIQFLCLWTESVFDTHKIWIKISFKHKLWNKTGGEAYIKQATLQVMFTRLHPGTHLTRINCHWKLCSLISKLHKLSTSYQSFMMVFNPNPFQQAQEGCASTAASNIRWLHSNWQFVSNGRLRISVWSVAVVDLNSPLFRKVTPPHWVIGFRRFETTKVLKVQEIDTTLDEEWAW